MKFRPLHLVLLAALVYWTTGTALYIHERVEHDEHETPSITQANKSDHSSPANHPAHHDHDNCSTCQLLAHIQADTATPPPVVGTHELLLIEPLIADRIPPSVEAASYLPIRGPPVTANSIA